MADKNEDQFSHPREKKIRRDFFFIDSDHGPPFYLGHLGHLKRSDFFVSVIQWSRWCFLYYAHTLCKVVFRNMPDDRTGRRGEYKVEYFIRDRSEDCARRGPTELELRMHTHARTRARLAHPISSVLLGRLSRHIDENMGWPR